MDNEDHVSHAGANRSQASSGDINFRINGNFVGRKNELSQLFKLTNKHRSVISITGGTGVGKTALVREFVTEHKIFVPVSLIANNVLDMNKEIDNLILEIRLSDKKLRYDNYLIVIDGADVFHNDEIQHFVAKLLNFKPIRNIILVSQRFLNIPHVEEIRLEPLSENEILELELLIRKNNEKDLPGLLLKTIIVTGEKTNEGKIIEIVTIPWFEILQCIQKNPADIYEIPADKWEEIVAGAYKRSGFDEVILTPRSGDYGRDVIAIKHGLGSVRVIDQVKAYKPDHLVKANDVRALMGVLQTDGASKGFLTTTSDFAPKIETDPLIVPFMPSRLELINGQKLQQRLIDLSK